MPPPSLEIAGAAASLSAVSQFSRSFSNGVYGFWAGCGVAGLGLGGGGFWPPGVGLFGALPGLGAPGVTG